MEKEPLLPPLNKQPAPDARQIMPVTGMPLGHPDEAGLKIADPSTSMSPYHKPKAKNESGFYRDNLIDAELKLGNIADKRARMIHKFIGMYAVQDKEPSKGLFEATEDYIVTKRASDLISKNKSNLKTDNHFRPITRRQKKTTKKLNRLQEKIVKNRLAYSFLTDSYGQDVATGQFRARRDTIKPTSTKETKAVIKGGSKAKMLDIKFTHLVNKRDEIVQKKLDKVIKKFK